MRIKRLSNADKLQTPRERKREREITRRQSKRKKRCRRGRRGAEEAEEEREEEEVQKREKV